MCATSLEVKCVCAGRQPGADLELESRLHAGTCPISKIPCRLIVIYVLQTLERRRYHIVNTAKPPRLSSSFSTDKDSLGRTYAHGVPSMRATSLFPYVSRRSCYTYLFALLRLDIIPHILSDTTEVCEALGDLQSNLAELPASGHGSFKT